MAKKLLEGNALVERAKELGVNVFTDEMYNQAGAGIQYHMAPEHEIQRRVIEVERSIRESRLWIVALVSAFASVISAVAAWWAICIYKH